MAIEFKAVDWTNVNYNVHPILPAKNVEYVGKKMQENNEEKLGVCPGMIDFKNYGWILPAWDEIKIHVSKNAVMTYYNDGDIQNKQQRGCPWKAAGKMSSDIPAGFEGSDIKYRPQHVTSPWNFVGDISLMALPPVYHSDITQYLTIFPGIVDYSENFGQINFIFHPKEEGIFTIKAGTPLLHLVPILKEDYVCNVTGGNQREKDRRAGMFARCSQFYRKYVMKKSSFKVQAKEND